ncbi:M20 family metallopeptidase [Clostridium swellfunianum]|uniref:M20 metallopeptidase family protein n=1 Tax=Clostridium swellfunianum TaxID=1367462 RepID=UPI00202FADE5|nr:M20 family metallopeptidase [Clostridium swellfunianum]MCM0650903.1 M20 family metallopeptidase [Clostridium swellfunianum]
MKKNLRNEVENIIDKVISIRRELHKYPEPALNEHKTAEFIASVLESMGVDTQRSIAGTGVVGVIFGSKPGKTLAIRADIDALNIEEKNEISYKSERKGYMHACGHDGHVAMAIGAAMVLNSIKDQIVGNIKFIFQPAEEQYGGAERMLKENVLDIPKVDAIIAAHLWPDVPKGKIGIKEGCIMASNDKIEIKLYGKSAHGAMPHLGKDAIIAATEVVSAIQSFIAREINPLDSAVVTIGTFNSGTAYNIVANEAMLTGTVRTIDNRTRDFAENRLRKIVEGICIASDVSFEFKYTKQYPATINNPEVTSFIREIGEEVLGKENVLMLTNPYMTAEDFAYYLQKVPGCMFFIGTRDDENKFPLHHEKFNFDERVLGIGVKLLTASAIKFLE